MPHENNITVVGWDSAAISAQRVYIIPNKL